jgi:hypothetical protein
MFDHTRRIYQGWEIVSPSLVPYIRSHVRFSFEGCILINSKIPFVQIIIAFVKLEHHTDDPLCFALLASV